MNWSIEEPTKDGISVRPLHWSFHKTLALAVVEANLKHAPGVNVIKDFLLGAK
jgi:hypothetical protein